MMGTKQEELEHGCLSKALDDEPMFVLLARDRTAPFMVRKWATQRRADIELGLKPDSDRAMVDEAFECADRMEAWRKENDEKWRTGMFAPTKPRQDPSDVVNEAIKRGMLGKDA